MEALVDKSAKDDDVNVPAKSSSKSAETATAKDAASHQSRTQSPAQDIPSLSPVSAEQCSQWDSLHNFLDGPATELDSIYDFTDLQPSVEQHDPHVARRDRSSNTTGALAPTVLSSDSMSYPTPPRTSAGVESDEQPFPGNLSGTSNTPTFAPQKIEGHALTERERQQQQKHYNGVSFPPSNTVPVTLAPVNMAMRPRMLSAPHR